MKGTGASYFTRLRGGDVTIPILLLVPVMLAAGQVLFKLASPAFVTGTGAIWYRLATNRYLLVALALYGVATLLWVFVLSKVPLGRAYPFIALTFVLVPLFSYFFLGETVGPVYIVGVLLVLAGVVLCQI